MICILVYKIAYLWIYKIYSFLALGSMHNYFLKTFEPHCLYGVNMEGCAFVLAAYLAKSF